MNDLIDKIILFIACLTLYAVDAGYSISVAPAIVALTLSALNSYLGKKSFRLVSLGAYLLICQLHLEFLVFLPLICYDVFVTDEQLFCLLILIPIVSHFNQYSLILGVMLFILIMISYLLKYRTLSFNKIHSQFINYIDNSKERSILLEKKNSDLMEKQDYEINVATLNERNRIAMEIHDNVGHLLSRCLLQIGAILAINKEAQLKESLSSVKNTMSLAMDSIRNSVHNLHDEAIDLYSQINGLATSFTFCTINLDYDLSTNIDTKLKYCFIAIVKEALSNIIRHSSATEVNITLREHPALYQLIIQDNGNVTGYNIDNGIGLTNISDRVRIFSGNIHINIENGFKIFISIPKGKQ
jgi:signal transduction histidine kinase